jgi:hypothetical protein
MATIKGHAYNSARSQLVTAGSNSARASHVKHPPDKSFPDDHGKALLREARDEFRNTDKDLEGNVSGMTRTHHDAIHSAAGKMGIGSW